MDLMLMDKIRQGGGIIDILAPLTRVKKILGT